MGFRTVVILNNDQCYDWENDKNLGRKISAAMNRVNDPERSDLGYGRVVECTHIDTQTIATIDGFNFDPITHGSWRKYELKESMTLKLVKAAAEKLGFRLVKISKKAE